MRGALIVVMGLLLVLIGFGVGRAADEDEAVMTVQVSSAEHESQEGYFSLGSDTTVIAKPGTELHRFLTRQNGRKIRVSVTPVAGGQLSRLEK